MSLLTAAQAGLPAGRLVPPENFHITLAFLDSHPEPVAEDVHFLLSTIRQAGMNLSIDRLAFFGEAPPRSLYAAVAQDLALTALRKKVRRAARDAGVALSSERFVPHVTLARFPKFMLPDDILAVRDVAARRMTQVAASFQVDSFALYRSHLRNEAPVYEVLAEYPLETQSELPVGGERPTDR